MKPFVLDFDLISGMCKSGRVKPMLRNVSSLKEQFSDTKAANEAIQNGDPLLYEFYGLENIPEVDGNLLFGTTTLYPGKIGDEYYMTKGHFHTVIDTAEVYYCLSGSGGMLMETPEGEVSYELISPGSAIYVPGRWAHRSINTGTEPLVMFFAYPAHAGHDYGTIEQKGYRKIVVERDGRPTLIDNVKWK